MLDLPAFQDRKIESLRGPKNVLNVRRPYGFFLEAEYSSRGALEPVAVVLLTNRECPFRCLMCDLWRNTVNQRVPVGAITEQVDYALGRLPPVKQVKLYNSGNFFDAQAIPPEEFPQIVARLNGMCTVIVENHPRLCGPACLEFKHLLDPGCELEIALGLETSHPDLLSRLNKQMTLADFQRAVDLLASQGIATRAFVLLRPPFVSEEEGVEWAIKSLDFAFSSGVRCCSLIPTRDGNGIMERLREQGHFTSPQLVSLERVLETAIRWNRGRVFADLWDLDRLASCSSCMHARRRRLKFMNETQCVPAPIACHCTGAT